jgi:hypothetical protein
MKKFALLLSFALVAGVAAADNTAKAPEAAKSVDKAHAEKAVAGKTHEVEAEVVSADATAKTLTLKGETENKTVPVEGKALASLKDVKAGEKVTLTCRDNEKGEHQAVVAIKAAKAAPVAVPADKK